MLCHDNRLTTKLFNYSIPELNEGCIYTHKGCVCNEQIGLHGRHLIDDGARMELCPPFKHLRRFVTHVSPWTEDQVIAMAASNKKALLKAAQQSLLTHPITPRDYSVKMFLKDDKYNNTEGVAQYLGIDDKLEFKAPRCIQYRNKRYNLRLATYLHPIEHHLYSQVNWNGTPIFAKSRNHMQRGQDLHEAWTSFVRPVAWLLDHSKYDAHCHLPLLKLEHRFYKMCNDSVELAELLNAQLINKGKTKNATKYTAFATRMSGDQNTGMGNSCGNYSMLREVFGANASYYIDGDDSVVITEHDFQPDMSKFKKFGMVTKYSTTTDFSQVEFCQCKPVFANSWVMVRNPYRFLTRVPWTLRQFGHKKKLAYIASVGECELALGLNLPVAQYVGHKMMAFSTSRIKTEGHWRIKTLQNRSPKQVQPPSYETRLSYQDAWGISIERQLELEATTLSLDVSFDQIEEYPFINNG